MIDGLIAGKLYGAPKQCTSKTGKPFATAKVRVVFAGRAAAGDAAAAAGGGESMFVNVIAFEAGACAALLALADGDSVAMAGSLTPKAWTDKTGAVRPSLDLVAHQVLTAYHVTHKRREIVAGPDSGAWEEI